MIPKKFPETPNNFRLAAALQSAQGLRQRTVIRRREITRRLTDLARQQAAQDRQKQIAGLESHLEHLTDRSDENLRTLLALQNQQDALARSFEADTVKRTQADAVPGFPSTAWTRRRRSTTLDFVM